MLFFEDVFLYVHNLMRLLQHIKIIYYIFSIDMIYCCFFVFYQIRIIYVWSTTVLIYFMAFIIQYMNIIEDTLFNLSLILNHFDKSFLISFIMFSSSRLKLTIIICCEKNSKILLYSFKSIRKYYL